MTPKMLCILLNDPQKVSRNLYLRFVYRRLLGRSRFSHRQDISWRFLNEKRRIHRIRVLIESCCQNTSRKMNNFVETSWNVAVLRLPFYIKLTNNGHAMSWNSSNELDERPETVISGREFVRSGYRNDL